eukprot:scaffold315_cov101-Isochrysis_galbana.AAC.2
MADVFPDASASAELCRARSIRYLEGGGEGGAEADPYLMREPVDGEHGQKVDLAIQLPGARPAIDVHPAPVVVGQLDRGSLVQREGGRGTTARAPAVRHPIVIPSAIPTVSMPPVVTRYGRMSRVSTLRQCRISGGGSIEMHEVMSTPDSDATGTMAIVSEKKAMLLKTKPACTSPGSRVLPLSLTFRLDRAMTAVTGMPMKAAEVIFATP